MKSKQLGYRVSVIDSHTAGEPTRTVIDGFPSLGGGTVMQQRQYFAQKFDHWRQAVILEPRGSDVLVGALLCPPAAPQASIGVIFFNNIGYLGMCGHGIIGVITSLYYLQHISPGKHIIETPVGLITAELYPQGKVSINNVPSYRYRQAVSVDVPGFGLVIGDIAWGGNWFFLISEHQQSLVKHNIDFLTEYTWAVREALEKQNITGENGQLIDHIELFAPDPQADSRNFVLCPGKVYDRSPCGTGTSAKLACLAADGLLAPGQIWRQKSIIGSQFEACYQWLDRQSIMPTIYGEAHLCGKGYLIISPDDPFAWGITL